VEDYTPKTSDSDSVEDSRIKADTENVPKTENQRQAGDNGGVKRTISHCVH